ncbi:MAG: Ig-like domain-containing protein [Spirochaetota bacterium]
MNKIINKAIYSANKLSQFLKPCSGILHFAIKLSFACFLLIFFSCSDSPLTGAGSNHAPEAYGKSVSVPLNTPTKIELDARDEDRDSLSYRIVNNPGHGTLQKASDNIYVFTPEDGYTSIDSFTFIANDGSADSNIAAIDMDIGPPNKIPNAYGNDGNPEFVPSSGEVTISLKADDPDGDTVTFHLQKQPEHGMLETHETSNQWKYTAETSVGRDEFSFYVKDTSSSVSNTATIYITIGYINSEPVIDDREKLYLETDEDSAITGTFPVTDYDIGLNGDRLFYEIINANIDPLIPNRYLTGHGHVDNNRDGSFIYTPDSNWNSVSYDNEGNPVNEDDFFAFRAVDMSGAFIEEKITMHVRPVNDPPYVPENYIAAVDKDSVDNYIYIPVTDIDLNENFTYNIEEYNGNGTLTAGTGPVPVFIYTPLPGSLDPDTFTYSVRDISGSPAGGTVTIIITEPHVIFVNVNAPDNSNDGSCWQKAFKNIQSAADKAYEGEQIWVAEGTYYPDAQISSMIITNKRLLIYGGFSGTENALSERDPVNNPVILNGNSLARILSVVSGGNVTIEGFTVTSGTAKSANNYADCGGGIFVSSGTVSLNNMTFSLNTAGYGGAVCGLPGSVITIDTCSFSGNSAGNGGAVYAGTPGTQNANSILKCSLNASSCAFTNNSANNGGAVFTAGDSDSAINNSAFSGNHSNIAGGAVFTASFSQDNPETGNRLDIANCTFNSNTSGASGGALYIMGKALITASSFGEYSELSGLRSYNTAAIDGGAIYNISTAVTEIDLCNFYGNLAAAGAGGALYNAGSCKITATDPENNLFWYNKSNNGGAVYNKSGTNNDTQIELENCRFSFNQPYNSGLDSYGGAIYNDRVSPAYTSCMFNQNSSRHGGAVFNCNYSSPVFYECGFTNNNASENGGAVNNVNSSPLFTNCEFSSNISYNEADGNYDAQMEVWTFTQIGGGGAVYNNSANPVFFGTIFHENQAQFGSVSFDTGNSFTEYINSLLYNNITNIINYVFNEYIHSQYGEGTIYSKAVKINIINCTFASNHQLSNNITEITASPIIFENVGEANIIHTILYPSDTGYVDKNNNSAITNSHNYISYDNPFQNEYYLTQLVPIYNPSPPHNIIGYTDGPCVNKGDNNLIRGYLTNEFYNEMQNRTTDSLTQKRDNDVMDMGYHYIIP